jgi:hypothetical protein
VVNVLDKAIIAISKETQAKLNDLKTDKAEHYDVIIQRLLKK